MRACTDSEWENPIAETEKELGNENELPGTAAAFPRFHYTVLLIFLKFSWVSPALDPRPYLDGDKGLLTLILEALALIINMVRKQGFVIVHSLSAVVLHKLFKSI